MPAKGWPSARPSRDLRPSSLGDRGNGDQGNGASPEWGAVSRMARELSSILGQEVNPTILSPEQWADETDGFVRQVRREPRLELPLDGAPNEGVA